jgi:RecB family exonuclease
MSAEEHQREVERASERGEGAKTVARALQGLHARLRPTESRTWQRFSAELSEWFGAFAGAGEDDAAVKAALRGTLEEMEELGRLPGEDRPRSFKAMHRWLEETVDGVNLALAGEDRGGIRVLDAMQARGLTFKHVHLLGMNSGLFPRAPREDPLLTDSMRQRLRDRTHRPLPVQAESPDEERLLLALSLGSASEGITVSWQRADEAGRSKSPSLALREIARLVYGRPATEALFADATHLPSHPGQWLDRLLDETGMLSPQEAMLAGALSSRGSESVAPLIERYEQLAPGLGMLELTESFGPVDPRFDGRVRAATDSPPALSVSDFETLGLCPLRFFFHRVLGVGELVDEPETAALTFYDVGSEVHNLLEQVYSRLLAENLFGTAPAQELSQRAMSLAERYWVETMDRLGARLARRLPVLWQELREGWLAGLRRFFDEDLKRIEDEQLRPVGFEESRRVKLELGDGVRVRVSARFDRRCEGAQGPIIGDYKTSGDLERRSNVTQMLKANTLQVPLYWLIGGADARVELCGVGPAYDEKDDAERRVVFDGFDDSRRHEGFLETLRTLADLVAKGRFPLHEGSHCGYCAYEQACRRLHPPTLERESHASDSERYRLLSKKKARAPQLEDVGVTESSGPAERR